MTKELVISQEEEEGKLPGKQRNQGDDGGDYKRGLSDFELGDFLSYLDNLKLDDQVSDKNGLERRGGGDLQKKSSYQGSRLRSKGPGSGDNKNNFYTAQGINFSCEKWTRQQRDVYYSQLPPFCQVNRNFSVKDEGMGQDTMDGPPGTNIPVVQISHQFKDETDIQTDEPYLESIIDSIPALGEFLHADLLQCGTERYDALTPYSQSTKSPEGPDLNDVMEVISDEEASKSPLNQSPNHEFASHRSPNNFQPSVFQSDKIFSDSDLFTGSQLDFNFTLADSSVSENAGVGMFTDNSQLDLFKPFDPINKGISKRNDLQALLDRQRNGLVLYDSDVVPAKRHQLSPNQSLNIEQDIIPDLFKPTGSDQGFVESHVAPAQLDPEIEKLLVIDSDGDSIIHSCVIAGITLESFEELLESLASKGVLNQIIDKQNGMWRTALFLAVMEKRIDLVDCLIGYHANPNIQGKVPYDLKKNIYDLRSPLHLVAEMGDEDIELLKIILESDDLDINGRSSSDRLTALHIALLSHKIGKDGKVIKNCSETIKLLMDHGADINIVEDRSSRTPVMLAIETADFQLVKDFLASMPGNDTVRWALQEVTRAGDTPLHLAAGLRLCPEQKARMIRFLVRQGANTNAENNIKELPEDVATKEVWRDLFKVR